MNAAKIQLSTGHNEAQGTGGPTIYHNIKKGWEISPEESALVSDAGWIFTKNAIIGKALALFGELSGILQERWRKEVWPEGQGDMLGRADMPEEKGMTEEKAMKGQMDISGILQAPPRISKGENYKGLPWVVLDYPRYFGRDHVFAVRTLFWWGNYFSVTLHLKGNYKAMFLPVIRENLSLLDGAGFMICVSDDEWRHELGQDNYQPLSVEGTGKTGDSGEADSPGWKADVEGDYATKADGVWAEDPSGVEAILQRQSFLKFSAKCDLQNWNEAGELLLQLSDIVIQALKDQR
ncbi:MAG TPA: hypothetical protein VK563_03120 [Puia sp.]|nr:hypothetical protein [Puia sp.]